MNARDMILSSHKEVKSSADMCDILAAEYGDAMESIESRMAEIIKSVQDKAFRAGVESVTKGTSVCYIATHEADRLIEADAMLDHLLTHCTYLEDGKEDGAYWHSIDEKRENMSLREYLKERIDGKIVPADLRDPDESEICGTCNGSGEGMYDGTRCHACRGSGAE